MNFFVTYCAMDQELASNPFWHACIILSYWPGIGQKIEAKECWGFYGSPMSNPDTIFGKIKAKLGLPIDLQGSYGTLKKEEMRYLDLGYGLRGVTFEVTGEQYKQLEKKCRDTIAEENLAITEAKNYLSNLNHTPTSYEIFEEEKRRAALEHRQPRLKPFEFQLSFDPDSFISLENSHTCKTMAVNLLQEIGIDQMHIDKIICDNASKVIPRKSRNLENLFLHSTGPRKEHVSNRTGKITFFREWQDSVKLFWTLPPQHLITSSEELKKLFILPAEYIDSLKKIIRQLQTIETTIVNTQLESNYEHYRSELIQHIGNLYSSFAIIDDSINLDDLDDKIAIAKDFLNSVYFAINDNWETLEDVETVAAKIPQEAQEKICAILGRSMARWDHVNCP